MVKATNNFHQEIIQRLWEYQLLRFPEWEGIFERGKEHGKRPPVFLKHQAWRNLLVNEENPTQPNQQLLGLIPVYERHRWFRSMTSSQALAQSVLGNLYISGNLNILNEVKDEDGQPVFGKIPIKSEMFVFEKKVNHLGEPRSTSLDAFICGDHPIAIECKFTEQEMGSCSRPSLVRTDSNYEKAHCNGSYLQQLNRKYRCTLTEIGVRYWEYVPQVFKWANDVDISPCPLNVNYQLVRNLLAVAVNLDCSVSLNNRHAVLIYDERNPAFCMGGKGDESYQMTRDTLRNPEMLKKCTWQNITGLIRAKKILTVLTQELFIKYGI